MKEDMVNHPKHYASQFKTKDLECVAITRHMSFLRGNAFKYVWRAGMKGDKEKAIEDLDKALWYLKELSKYPAADSNIVAANAVFECLEDDGYEKYQLLSSILDPQQDNIAGSSLREGYIRHMQTQFMTREA